MNYPSVTQVISPWIDWSKVPPDKLEFAATRGTQIHRIIASILQGLWVPETPESCEPYIESFRLWLPCIEEVVFVEETLICDSYGFKGTPDAVVKFKGDEYYSLVDWKSPVVESKSWRLQIAAYHDLSIRRIWSLRDGIRRTGVLQLSPKGKPAKFREYTGTLHSDFAVFLNCLTVYNFFNGGK